MPVNKNIDKRNSNIKIYINGSFLTEMMQKYQFLIVVFF